MTMGHLFRLSLTAAVLVLASPALADTDYNDELIQALARIYDWGPDVAKVMTTPGKTYVEMKAEIKALNEKLVADLRKRQCKDKAQADHIESETHKLFHEWYTTVAPDIKHGVNMSCSPDHKLVPTVWITDFKLLPKWEAGVKKADAGATTPATAKPSPAKPSSAMPTHDTYGCTTAQLNTPGGKACVKLAEKDIVSGKAYHVLVCKTSAPQCCTTNDGKSVSNCVAAK